ncbi:MAG: hypothetical protein EA412_00020 [Chitinophagaceae bacterium]|nr:MAG: hypothetical protein EA412_00020 [Chitinophagaceae bacterium]
MAFEKQLKLPVSNKPTAYLRNAFMLSVILIVFLSLYIHYQEIRILVALLIVIIPLAILLIFSQRKQNIQSLEFAQNKLIVSYPKHKIEIPLSQIQEITAGINLGFNLKFNLIKTYTIVLNKKYFFGKKLLVDYKIDNNTGVTIKEDPISIKVLKIETQRTQADII